VANISELGGGKTTVKLVDAVISKTNIRYGSLDKERLSTSYGS